MSLSDLFCVERHKPHFLEIVKNSLDITFANEQEMMSLINAKNFEEVVEFSKDIKKLIVVTRGEKGALAIQGDNVVEIGAKKDLKIVDLTGAETYLQEVFYMDTLTENPLRKSRDRTRNVFKNYTSYWSSSKLNYFSSLKLPFPFLV